MRHPSFCIPLSLIDEKFKVKPYKLLSSMAKLSTNLIYYLDLLYICSCGAFRAFFYAVLYTVAFSQAAETV